MPIFNVTDFGATGDGSTDDTAAIQAAINAAHAAGGGDVYVPTGLYRVSGTSDKSDGALRMLDNVTVHGDGMGNTVIKLVDGWNGNITGLMRTPFNEETSNVAVRDLTLDGNRDNTSGKVDGWFNGVRPEDPRQDSNITLERVEIANMSGYGFDPHEQTINMVIRDSVSHGNGLDGFVADFLINSIFEGNVSYGNDRHGFNVVTSTHEFTLKNNTAYDNGSAGVAIQRGSEDIPWPVNILVDGGDFYNNAKEGILVKMSDFVTIRNADIHDNGTNGIRLYGVTNSTVENNNVFNNSQNGNNKYDEIRLQEYDDQGGASGELYPSLQNIISGNVIYADGAIRARDGVREFADSSDFTFVFDNTISGVNGNDVTLNGFNSGEHAPDEDPGDPIVGFRGTDGDDKLIGTDDNNEMQGVKGDDTLKGGAGDDTLDGGSGDDVLLGGSGNDDLLGGSGNDHLNGGSNEDYLYGSSGHDTLVGGKGNDTLEGGSGDDRVLGGSDDDLMKGNDGNDYLSGYLGNDELRGGKGDDTLNGGADDDTLRGDSGNDLLVGKSGEDVLFGNSDQDTLIGGKGYDTLDGGTGDDQLRGDNGDDLLLGNDGADILHGSDDNDTLDGGKGDDRLTGGSGIDRFDFASSFGNDTITDFTPGSELIRFASSLVASKTAILALTSYASGDAFIDFGGGNSLLLENVANGALDTDDFELF